MEETKQIAAKPTVLDKTGREIMVGDTLKVFHFVDVLRKTHYMYKFVEAKECWRTWTRPMLRISHLAAAHKPQENGGNCYYEALDGRVMEHVEIVQGYGEDGTPFEDRPILAENEESVENEHARDLESARNAALSSLAELHKALIRYEADVDCEAPSEHNRMMERAAALLQQNDKR